MAQSAISPGTRDVLIVTDIQNDFIPGGSLAVPRGDEIISTVNELAGLFTNVVLTQDWHPQGHRSFASSYSGMKPFQSVKLSYGEQILWPDHCVQNSPGAQLHAALNVPHAQLVIRKGYHHDVDSYSVFIEADGKTHTGLAGYLRERGIGQVYICGLATDFCVAWSALDAVKLGFHAVVVEDACRAIDTQGSLAAALQAMDNAGVQRVKSAQFR